MADSPTDRMPLASMSSEDLRSPGNHNNDHGGEIVEVQIDDYSNDAIMEPGSQPQTPTSTTPYRTPIRDTLNPDTANSYGGQVPRKRNVRGLVSPYDEKQEEMNTLFGMHKWKGHLSKRPLSERSEIVRRLYTDGEVQEPVTVKRQYALFGNLVYTALIGWWLSILYYLLGMFMWFSIFGQGYMEFCWALAEYSLWPFGKYVLREIDPNAAPSQSTPLMSHEGDLQNHSVDHQRCSGKKHKVQFAIWCLVIPLLWLFHGFAFFLCGFFVVLMPMAKVHIRTLKTLLYADPSTITISKDGPRPGYEVIVCAYQAVNVHYYKYSVGGMNIVLVNLLSFVILSICFGKIPVLKEMTSETGLFCMSLLSVIPLAYYIGMAISSISAQSSYAVGAVLNATFGSIVELLVYQTALMKTDGGKNYLPLVTASLTGSLLATMLFIPGICMIIGGFKYKEQRFNMRSAGVSSSLLFVSVAGAYSPSVFHRAFGAHTLTCDSCVGAGNNGGLPVNIVNTTQAIVCSLCHWDAAEFADDPIYRNHTRKLVYACAALLPIAYIIGLVFTLRTHTHIYEKQNEDEDEPDSHHGPKWSRVYATVVLLLATAALGIVAELLVDNLEGLTKEAGLSEVFIGATIIALIPDIAEIVNGIQFALQNNIALSIEVGSSIAVQICLIQMPVLVILSEIFGHHDNRAFRMIFSDVYVWSVLFSVILMNYTFMDGKSDYFQGATLVIVYIMLVMMLFFTPTDEEL